MPLPAMPHIKRINVSLMRVKTRANLHSSHLQNQDVSARLSTQYNVSICKLLNSKSTQVQSNSPPSSSARQPRGTNVSIINV